MNQLSMPTKWFATLKRRHSWLPLLLCWILATAMFLFIVANESPKDLPIPLSPETTSKEIVATQADDDFSGIVSESALQRVFEETMPNETTKVILMWCRNDPGMTGNFLGGCPEYNCVISGDQQLYNVSSAVVFEGFTGAGVAKDVRLTLGRTNWRRFVFFHQESPVHFQTSKSDLTNENFYNWTLTYRRDADLPSPYGYTVKRSTPRPIGINVTQLHKRKTKLAAWFVSNCNSNSGREKYVRELQKFMPVDIYGGCGTLSCSKENREEKCLRLLANDYKFYFAFENSICRDYITEKFWMKMKSPVILVVLSRSIVAPYAPPHSFVAVDDFNSPKELADHLNLVANSAQLYAEYFQWRKQFEIVFLNGVEHDSFEKPWGFCLLCKKLWTDAERHSTYSDFHEWFSQQAECAGSTMVDKQLGKSDKKLPTLNSQNLTKSP